MQYRRLGRAGLRVSTLSLGSWVTYHNQVDTGQAAEMMAAAYDAGVNFFDNAEVYASGRSEEIMGVALKQLAWPGLNEYDGEALVRAIHTGPAPDTHTPEGYREHFRLLRSALRAWMAGESSPQGMPRYAAWVAGITAALDHVRTQHSGDVLVISSGGPIATIVGQVLGTPAAATIELNMRIRNSALTELAYTPKRFALVAFNHVPHLDSAARRGWVTYS